MALRVCTIASGSKGNCIYVSSGNAEFVVDLGISYTHAQKCVRLLGGEGINNIVLTHTHSDHFSHVPQALAKGATLYYNEGSRADVIGIEGKKIETSGRFEIGDISLLPFAVSHDVPCVGYTVKCGNSKLSIVTDLGYLPGKCMDAISGSGLVILESNYDENMLESNRSYPLWLKRRISGTYGHLSNTAAANAVCELSECGVERVILAHISENNNTPQRALDTCRAALKRIGRLGKTELTTAGQYEIGSFYEVV